MTLAYLRALVKRALEAHDVERLYNVLLALLACAEALQALMEIEEDGGGLLTSATSASDLVYAIEVACAALKQLEDA